MGSRARIGAMLLLLLVACRSEKGSTVVSNNSAAAQSQKVVLTYVWRDSADPSVFKAVIDLRLATLGINGLQVLPRVEGENRSLDIELPNASDDQVKQVKKLVEQPVELALQVGTASQPLRAGDIKGVRVSPAERPVVEVQLAGVAPMTAGQKVGVLLDGKPVMDVVVDGQDQGGAVRFRSSNETSPRDAEADMQQLSDLLSAAASPGPLFSAQRP